MKSFLFFLCRAATLFIVNAVSGVELAITSPGRHAVCFFSLTSLQKIKCELKLPVSAASTTTLHYKLHYKLHTERLFGGREHLLRSSRNGGLGGGAAESSRVASHSSLLEHPPAWGATGEDLRMKPHKRSAVTTSHVENWLFLRC